MADRTEAARSDAARTRKRRAAARKAAKPTGESGMQSECKEVVGHRPQGLRGAEKVWAERRHKRTE